MAWRVCAILKEPAGERPAAPIHCGTHQYVVAIYRAYLAEDIARVWIEDDNGKEVSPRQFGIDDGR